MLIYCDSSALVKLIADEAESEALDQWLGEQVEPHWVSTVLARTEVLRAVRRCGDEMLTKATELLDSLSIVELEAGLADAAGSQDPPSLWMPFISPPLRGSAQRSPPSWPTTRGSCRPPRRSGSPWSSRACTRRPPGRSRRDDRNKRGVVLDCTVGYVYAVDACRSPWSATWACDG